LPERGQLSAPGGGTDPVTAILPQGRGNTVNAGLLWFDNDPARTIAAKVTDAAQRFVEKFGLTPSVCYVNRRAVESETVISFGEGEIKVAPVPNILVNHFWVGIEG
jgi:hypothetical protein